jgi:HSP20 family protein
MTVVRYEPWGFVNRFHNQVANQVAWLQSVDVREEENRFVVQVDLPGVESKDIEVTADKGVLTIKGERKSERFGGTFLRRFTLPDNTQADAITAKQANGVLEVSIPKQAEVQPKRIEVHAA